MKWRDIVVGDTVRGGDGKEWIVGAVGPGLIVVERGSRTHPFSPDPDGEVELVSASAMRVVPVPPGQDPEVALQEHGEAVAQIHLGAEVIATFQSDGVYVCPHRKGYDEPSLRSHLYLFHRFNAGRVESLEALHEVHDGLHNDDQHLSVVHIHSDVLHRRTR